jgi:hypothetical protein
MFALDDHMLALGSIIAGCGILLAGLLALLFRNPEAPRWARPELVAMLACVPVTAIIGLGLGYAAYGVSQLVGGAGNPGELLVLAAVLIVLALAWRALGIRRRLRAYAAASGDISSTRYLATAPSLVIDETPPPPRPRTRPSSRRAA